MKVQALSRPADWALPVLALLVLLLGGISFNFDRRLPPPVWEGRDLVSGLDPEAVTKITIGKDVTLARRGKAFFVESADGAPADFEKVNELFLRLGGAQIARSIGEKEKWQSDLLVTVSAANNQWEIDFGKAMPAHQGLPVKVNGRNEVFLTTEHLWFPRTSDYYISKTAFFIDPEKITSLQMTSEGRPLPEDKFAKDDLLAVFAPLQVLRHVRTGSKGQGLEGINWDWQTLLTHESGVVYAIDLGRKDERWFARARATLANTPDTSGPILDVMALTARSQAERFNQEKLPWVWELSTESVAKIKKGLKL